MDFGPDVNSIANSSSDIGIDIDVWRSRICKQGHSSLVRVVGGRRRFHDAVHDVSLSARGELPSAIVDGWLGASSAYLWRC